MPGPVGYLDHPEEGPKRRKLLAEMYAGGATRAEMAEAFDCHVDTITSYTARPDVQALITEFARQRVNRITRRIDAELENRVEANVGKMSVEELLKVRRELTPQRLEITPKADPDAAAMEVLKEFFQQALEPGEAPPQIEGSAVEVEDV